MKEGMKGGCQREILTLTQSIHHNDVYIASPIKTGLSFEQCIYINVPVIHNNV